MFTKKTSTNESPTGVSKKESRRTIGGLTLSNRDLSGGSRISSSASSTASPASPGGVKVVEDGLIYDQDTGFISAATVEKSVHTLTSQLQSGGFLTEFLMLYKLFLSPTEFLSKLIDKLRASQGDAVARLRVVNIVKTWIKEYPQDWLPTEALNQNLSAFIDGINKDPELEKVMSSIKIVLSKTSTITTANSGASSATASPSPAGNLATNRAAPLTQLRIANQIKNLKDLTAAELVEQLTLLDQELYDPVSPSDLIVWTLQPKERETRASKLVRYLERFSEIRSWATSAIVGEPEKADRVEVITKLIAIAESALDSGSFNLCAAIVSGLLHPALNKLADTWRALSSETRATLDQLKIVCDSRDCYASMWSAMSLWRAPCIPFIGGIIEKLEQLHNNKNSGPMFITQAGTPGTETDLINFSRLRPLLDTANEIRFLRSAGLSMKPKQQIQTLFRKLYALDDESLAVKVETIKEAPVANPSSPLRPGWLIALPPTPKPTGVSSRELNLGGSIDSTRKISISPSPVSRTDNRSPSRRGSNAPTPKSPRGKPDALAANPPDPSIPKLDMGKVKTPRTVASQSPTSKSALRPPSDDEKASPTSVPKPTVPPSIASPRPSRSGSTTMLLQLAKLEPRSGSASAVAGTVASPTTTEKRSGSGSALMNNGTIPSPSGSSSPLGSSRESTPPPEIPALPVTSPAPVVTATKKPAESPRRVTTSGTAAPAVPVPQLKTEKVAKADLTPDLDSPFSLGPEDAAKSLQRSESRSSATAKSPPPTPKEIENLMLDSPFEEVEVIEKALSPRGNGTGSAHVRSQTMTNLPSVASPVQSPQLMQRSQSAAVGEPVSRASSATLPQRTVIPVPANASKEDIRRSQIVAEIFDTERAYVGFLDLLVKDGIDPIRKGNVLPDSDVKAIFSNIETIADFHKIFFNELSDIVASWTIDQSEVGSVFEKYHQYFKLYVEFVNNFDKSNALLTKQLSKVSKLKEIQTNLVKKSGKLDFGALLIMPIQRVPRYVLLLKDLRSRTPEDHPDYAHLQQAVKSVKDISLHINTSKKDAELNAKALELKKRLSGFSGELIKPGRRFIRETDAHIISPKGATRVVLLFWNDFLMLCRPQDKKLNYLGQFATGKLQLRTLMPKEMKKKLRSTGKEVKEISTDKYRFFVCLTFFDVEIILAMKTDQDLQQLLDDHKSAQLEMSARWFKKVSGGEGLPAPEARDNVGHALLSQLNPTTGTFSNMWYIYGGSYKTTFYDDLWALDFEKTQWTRVDANAKGEKPGPRADHVLVAVGRRLFVIGGHNQGQFVRDIYVYHIDSNTWQRGPALPLGARGAAPTGRAGLSAVVAEGRFILLFGGSHFENVSSQQMYNELWIFDTRNFAWTPGPGDVSNVPARSFHSCALLNGDNMVIYGGKGKENRDLNDMHYYDKNIGEWSTITNASGQVPSARSACGVAADDDGSRLIVYGGGSIEDTYSDLFVFRMRDRAWSLCSLPMDLPKRKSHALVLVPDTTSTSSLAIFGGRVQNSDGAMEYRNDVLIIKDIRKYICGASADSLKQAEKLKRKAGKLSTYSVSKVGSSAKFEEISASYNFVHRVHVDSDFRWDMDQNPLQVFQFGEMMGRGAFGEVWRAKHIQSKFELAIKKVPVQGNNFELLSKEMEILKNMRHPSIVKYFGFTQVEQENWIMMEFCEMGSLRDLMRLSRKTLSEKQAAAVIASVVHGLVYLHQINILHRDIKSANILLGSGVDVAKLSDFGLADFNTNQLSGSLSGSLPFMAPEVVQDRKYSVKSDIFALGVTLIELLENTPPFDKLQRPKKISADAQDFINQCLSANPDKRPSAAQLEQHPFVAKAPVPSADLFKDLIDAAKKGKTKRSPSGMILSASNSSIPATSAGASREVPSQSSIGSTGNDRSLGSVSSAATEELKAENARLTLRIDQQDSEIELLKSQNAILEARLAALERHLGLAGIADEHHQQSQETMAESMIETLHPTDLVHSSDSLLNVGLLPQ